MASRKLVIRRTNIWNVNSTISKSLRTSWKEEDSFSVLITNGVDEFLMYRSDIKAPHSLVQRKTELALHIFEETAIEGRILSMLKPEMSAY